MSTMKLSGAKLLACAVLLLAGSVLCDAERLDPPDRPVLELLPRDSNGWIGLQSPADAGTVTVLEASSDLKTWLPIARAHEGLVRFPDPASAEERFRFYRAANVPITAADDWKNQIHFPNDPFLSAFTGHPGDAVRWVKFAIRLNEPTRVYYQDSGKYPFHYEFAVKRLEPFVGMSRSEFDRVSLRSSGQQVVLGAVLFPPLGKTNEFGIQFVGLDPYPREQLADWFNLVKATVAADPSVPGIYIPVFEQSRAAQADRAYFESRGILLGTTDRWLLGNQIYSIGWAIGRLKFVPSNEINAAFAEGTLRPQDILLTDGVPAEIPVLAGVISLAPSTPNSHVAILARSFGIPFVYLVDPAIRSRAQALAGNEVALRAGRPDFGGGVDLFALDATMDPALKAEIAALKAARPIAIPRKQAFGGYVAPTDSLVPSDIKFFGGKAANFGLLRRSIPGNSPEAIALSIDLWDAFLEQRLPSGNTLRSEINTRLSGFSYPPEMAVLRQSLAEVRELITDVARFAPELQHVVTNALVSAGFNPTRKIRFRSSTNVEDSGQFTGAGLYDSYSGCLADDLDDDVTGPSACDPTRLKERGVFRAIQKVYASFYNDNAFLERLRHGIAENDVGMGVLVHHSAPDETEMANGVVALRYRTSPATTNITAEIVTQLGAVSVSNPDTTARPEVQSSLLLGERTYFDTKERSSLVPLGGYVMEWEKDYAELMKLLYAVTGEFRKYSAKTNFVLDFEFKKLQPGVLSVKQVREIPDPLQPPDLTPYLLNSGGAWTVHQGEFGDIFGNHRLKSELALHTRNTQLTDAALTESIFTHARLTYLDGTEVKVVEGNIPEFPEATHTFNGEETHDQWTLGTGENRRVYRLITGIERSVPSPEQTLKTLPDFFVRLNVEFAVPLPTLDWDGQPATTRSHDVLLRPEWSDDAPSTPVERTFRGENGLEIQTRFLWYTPKTGGVEIKTWPLLRFEETRISGLTSTPIVLRGFYSQTYRPGHHNFVDDFIFEPALESGLDAGLLAELRAANVQLIHVRWGEGTGAVQALGLDGEFRSLGNAAPPGKKL